MNRDDRPSDHILASYIPLLVRAAEESWDAGMILVKCDGAELVQEVLGGGFLMFARARCCMLL